jgi:putative ABC transport system substrate-binding protein
VGCAFAFSDAFAQSSGKTHRIGILSVDGPETAKRIEKTFTDRMVELGWRPGQSIYIDFRRVDPPGGLRDEARRLIASKPDLLVAVGPHTAATLKAATDAIPTVFVAASGPVEAGLVASLARPGGNITGVTQAPSIGMGPKSAEILKEVLPKAQRFAVMINPEQPAWKREGNLERYLQFIGKSLNLTVIAVAVQRSEDLPDAFEAARQARAEGMVVVADSVIDKLAPQTVQLAAKHRMPVAYPYPIHVEAGGLMAYSTNMRGVVRRGAEFADKILRGAKPADLPVEEPTKYELVINMRTAKDLGITIPRSILLRADRVIE